MVNVAFLLYSSVAVEKLQGRIVRGQICIIFYMKLDLGKAHSHLRMVLGAYFHTQAALCAQFGLY